MEKLTLKKAALYLLYGLITVLFLVFILSMGDVGEILSTVRDADPLYLLSALLTVAVYIALYPMSLVILTRASGSDIRSRHTYSIAMLEHFFNGITPFATGGQPFQAYAFSKYKVKLADSTCLLLMNFMVFMTVTNGFALCSLFYADRFVTTPAMAALAAVGFTMNFIVFVMTVLLATSRRACALVCKLVDLLCRIGFLKKLLEPRVQALKDYFVRVQTAFSALIKNKRAFALALIMKAISMAAYYATTFFILKALYVDVPYSDMLFVLLGSSFAITMVVFIPTPGSSGGIEFAFKSVLSGIALGASASVALGGMLIWRLLTYYFVMLVSLCFYIAFEIGMRRRAKKTPDHADNEQDK